MQKTDLGHGRGWASPRAAASILRIDRQLGRVADINEAGRSPEQADKNYRAWIAYQNGTGPKAPYALPASESVHCQGDAADSDDWYTPSAAAVWRDNGWRQTALYPNNPKKNEPWHGEYFEDLDNHRNQPAGGFTTTPTTERRLDMITCKIVTPQGVMYALVGVRYFQVLTEAQYNNQRRLWGDAVNLSYAEWDEAWNLAGGAGKAPRP